MRFASVLLLVACSGKPKHIEDARHPLDTGSAAVAADAPPIADAAPPPATTGDVQVRVEWPAMPLAARISPGASACTTPLATQVAPTTTWGIPEVVVFVDGAPPPRPDARVVVDRCSIAPRIAIGTQLAIASAADQPLRVSLAKRFTADVHPAKGAGIPVALPIAGHEVTTALEAGAIYRVAADGKVDDAWIVAASAAITDASGVAQIKDLAPGPHAVRAWLPPRGGQPARTAKGTVTVEIGDLAELTLTLE